MKRNLKAALISMPLVLLLHFASLAQSSNLLLSKNANGPISNGSLSLTLTSNASSDETRGHIPDGSMLVSNNFLMRTDSRGLGTFSGSAQIVAPDRRVLVQGSMRGAVGVKRRCDPSASDSNCRAPGRLEGIFEVTLSTISQVFVANFTAEPCLQCAPPTPSYRGVLDGVASGLPPVESQVEIASDEPSFIGRVSVTTDKSVYDVGETIKAKVANGLERTIVTWDHQSYCTILTMQRLESTGSWVDIALCPLETPTRLVRISPLTDVFVKLPADSSGIYRLRLTWQFVDDSGQPSGDLMTTYSPQFTITSSH
jgi:hypothetical protein